MKLGTTEISKIYLGSTEITSGYLGTASIYSSGPVVDYTEPFYIKNPNNSAITATIKRSNSQAPSLSIQYSSDKTTWTNLGTTSTSGLTISVPANSKMYFRCSTDYWAYSSYYNYFTATSSFNIGGNILSLLYGSNFTGNETSLPSVSSASFYSLRSVFKDSVNLIDASRLMLPATTLLTGCYQYMFSGCTGLTTAPETLPATTLQTNCYQQMFYGCTSLTTPPTLPATTLANDCYNNMFSGCTSLTTAPDLPATTLTSGCYRGMFFGCSNLNYIKCLATSITASNCTTYWVYDVVTPTGTFVKNANMSSWTTGVSGIPTGWTVQNA